LKQDRRERLRVRSGVDPSVHDRGSGKHLKGNRAGQNLAGSQRRRKTGLRVEEKKAEKLPSTKIRLRKTKSEEGKGVVREFWKATKAETSVTVGLTKSGASGGISQLLSLRTITRRYQQENSSLTSETA